MAGMETGAALLKVGMTMMRAAPSGIALRNILDIKLRDACGRMLEEIAIMPCTLVTNPQSTKSADSVIAHPAKTPARQFMAQAKREQINIVGKEAAPMKTEVNTVPDLLLQKHRLFVVRSIANKISFRLFFMLIAAGLIFIKQLSLAHLIASALVVVFSAYLCAVERKAMIGRVRGVERILAQRSGEDWEDTYIVYHNLRLDVAGKYDPHYEPFIWAALVTLLAAWRIIALKLGL